MNSCFSGNTHLLFLSTNTLRSNDLSSLEMSVDAKSISNCVSAKPWLISFILWVREMECIVDVQKSLETMDNALVDIFGSFFLFFFLFLFRTLLITLWKTISCSQIMFPNYASNDDWSCSYYTHHHNIRNVRQVLFHHNFFQYWKNYSFAKIDVQNNFIFFVPTRITVHYKSAAFFSSSGWLFFNNICLFV